MTYQCMQMLNISVWRDCSIELQKTNEKLTDCICFTSLFNSTVVAITLIREMFRLNAITCEEGIHLKTMESVFAWIQSDFMPGYSLTTGDHRRW